MLKEKIKKVLEELHCKAYEGSNSEDDVTQALTDITKIIEEEKGK